MGEEKVYLRKIVGAGNYVLKQISYLNSKIETPTGAVFGPKPKKYSIFVVLSGFISAQNIKIDQKYRNRNKIKSYTGLGNHVYVEPVEDVVQ